MSHYIEKDTEKGKAEIEAIKRTIGYVNDLLKKVYKEHDHKTIKGIEVELLLPEEIGQIQLRANLKNEKS